MSEITRSERSFELGSIKEVVPQQLDLNGKYHWELLLDIDNSNNAGTFRRQLEIKTSIFCSYTNMQTTIETSDAAASVGLNLSGTIYKVFHIGYKGELSYEAQASYESILESHTEVRTETTKTDSYEVGPHSRLKLYRLVFNGPGISYDTDTLSSEPHDVDDVIITYSIKQLYFLKDIDVVYTAEPVSRPTDLIVERAGLNADINADFGGDYVWLVPRWTTRLAECANGIQIAIQGKYNSNFKDLARGAGGAYRYIVFLRDTHSSQRITKIALYRAKSWYDSPLKNGWEFMTEDINKFRKGDYLYLVWNTTYKDA